MGKAPAEIVREARILRARQASHSFTRRGFCRFAGGMAGLAIVLPREATAKTIEFMACSDLLTARQAVCDARALLQPYFDEIVNLGFPYQNAQAPLTPAEIAQRRQDIAGIVSQLVQNLDHYPREVIEQLTEPEFSGIVTQSRAYSVDIMASSGEVFTAMTTPTVLASTFGSAGFVILGIVLAALTGLGPDELLPLNGTLEKTIGSFEKFVKALTNGEFKRAAKLLSGILSRITAALKKLGGKAAAKALSAIGAKSVPFLGTFLLALGLAYAIYENWDKLKEHLG